MNEKTAYEQIITGKLQAIPVPDMADAIWARIERQLDVDMPDTDLPPNDPPRFPTGGTIMGGISIVFIIVFISFFLLQKKDNNKQPLLQPATTTTPVQKENKTFNAPDVGTKRTRDGATLPSATTAFPLPSSDSNITTTSIVLTGNDSALSNPVAVSTHVIAPQKQDTLPPLKKGRGVAGIKDGDYRIVPKKDSVNNN